MPITWTCDPPEFAAYINHITAVDAGDFVLIELDMRCKRVPGPASFCAWAWPTNASARTVWDEAAQEYVHSGHLDITFATDDDEAVIVYPRRLGDYTGARPTVIIHHGRTDLAVEAEYTGRYTVRVMLVREGVAGSSIEVGDEPTAAAHKHGAEHGWPAQEKT